VKKTALTLVVALAGLLVFAGCGEKAQTTTHEDTAAATGHEGHDHAAEAQPAGMWTGTVAETMDSGGYTYVLLDTGSEKIWTAGPVTAVEVGQKVNIPQGMKMVNFPSKSLDRTFEEIYFVGGIYPEGTMPGGQAAMGGMGQMPQDASHGGMGGMAGGSGANANTKVADAHVEGVNKVAGGLTIAEIFAQKDALKGQPVKVRGEVVKFSGNIMGTNWVHIQDGSGGDLTVTTDAVVATGDIVVVEGPLTVNKDFGAGYRYDAIIEKASVTKE
jgi:hypothetical protein